MVEMGVCDKINLALYKSGYGSYSIQEDNGRYSLEVVSDMFLGCPALYRQMLIWDDLKCELDSDTMNSIIVIKTMSHSESDERQEVL